MMEKGNPRTWHERRQTAGKEGIVEGRENRLKTQIRAQTRTTLKVYLKTLEDVLAFCFASPPSILMVIDQWSINIRAVLHKTMERRL